MEKLKSFAARLDTVAEQSARRIHRMLSVWMFGDVGYAVLPLVVLAVLTRAMNGSFDHFLLLKEWSFASIVLYGTAVRKFIKLKADLQNNPRSYKLDVGVQFQIFMVIASVLVLALVVLHEQHHIPGVDVKVLGALQIVLFAISVMSIFGLILAEEYETPTAYVKSGAWTHSYTLSALAHQIDLAGRRLDHVNYLLEKATKVSFKAPTDDVRERVDLPHAEREIEDAADRIAAMSQEIAQRVATLRQQSGAA